MHDIRKFNQHPYYNVNMRKKGAYAAALLLLATLVLQVSAAEDIYWEGEDGQESEFLEVKEESPLKRIKRDWSLSNLFNPFSTSSVTTTAAPDNYEVVTEDQDDTGDANDFDNHADGSGATPERTEPDPSEKTLRVSFVVMEPFRDEYSNRDSESFQSFSHNLANAVNALFEELPGTQKSSLVRIQSRPADSFTCKVTLDIVTTVDNTDKISDLLRVHIRNTHTLGSYTLTDTDYSANVVNPGSEPGQDSDFSQVVQPVRCNNPIPCDSSAVTICPEMKCDGNVDCPLGEDEDPRACQPTEAPERGDQTLQTTPSVSYKETTRSEYPVPEQACPVGEFRCDESRCILQSSVCDQRRDCSDGTDESNCNTMIRLFIVSPSFL